MAETKSILNSHLLTRNTDGPEDAEPGSTGG